MILALLVSQAMAAPPVHLEGLTVPAPDGWTAEHKPDVGHWVVRSPGPASSATFAMVQALPVGAPSEAVAVVEKLKSDATFLDSSFVWVGDVKVEALDDGFVLTGKQKATWDTSTESALLVVRKLGPGWVTCHPATLGKSSDAAAVRSMCVGLR